LEEEEEAKAALMSRIQRLTKLILVSSKNNIPYLGDVAGHQRNLSEDVSSSITLFPTCFHEFVSDIRGLFGKIILLFLAILMPFSSSCLSLSYRLLHHKERK